MISPHSFSTVKSNIQHFCCSSPLWSRESHFQMSASSVFGKNHLIFGLFGHWKLGGSFAGKKNAAQKRFQKNSMWSWLLKGDAFSNNFHQTFPLNMEICAQTLVKCDWCDSFESLNFFKACFAIHPVSQNIQIQVSKSLFLSSYSYFLHTKKLHPKAFSLEKIVHVHFPTLFLQQPLGICSPSQKHMRPNAMFSRQNHQWRNSS